MYSGWQTITRSGIDSGECEELCPVDGVVVLFQIGGCHRVVHALQVAQLDVRTHVLGPVRFRCASRVGRFAYLGLFESGQREEPVQISFVARGSTRSRREVVVAVAMPMPDCPM